MILCDKFDCNSLFTSINPLDGLDSNGGTNVNVPGKGSHANQEPIFIKGSKLLVDSSLDKVSPFRNLHFARSKSETQNVINKYESITPKQMLKILFEKGGQSPDELVLIDVFN